MTIDSNVFIADGAKVLGDVTIKEGSSVWYNAGIRADMEPVIIGKLITQNKTFPEGSLILGSPAKAVRQLTTGEIDKIRHNAEEYLVLVKKLGAGR